jgi:hypothetical protein
MAHDKPKLLASASNSRAAQLRIKLAVPLPRRLASFVQASRLLANPV